MNKFAIFVIGPPGSGKSTIAKFLESKLSLKRISAGDLLRKLAYSEVGIDSILAKKAIESGVGADDDLILKIYKTNIRTSKKGLIFDGNPGGKSQLLKTINLLNEKSIFNIFCIKLKCSKKICVERILKRNQKRNDDAMYIINERFHWYNTRVIEAYKILQKQVKANLVVNTNRTFGEIEASILASFLSP